MNLTSVMQNNQDVSVEQSKLIKITKKTVLFGSEVFQFRNITGFELAEIKTGDGIPISIILVGFVIGLILALIPAFRPVGILMALLAICALIVKVSQSKQYALKISLNSGERKLFVTPDKKGLMEVISTLYRFMESDLDGTYTINLDDHSIRIDGGSVGGSILNGSTIGGSVSSHVEGNVSSNF